MVNYVCAKSPRFHQIVSNKRSKIKISWGSMPPDHSSLPYICTQIHTCPQKYPYNLILPAPLGKDLKETLARLSYKVAMVESMSRTFFTLAT